MRENSDDIGVQGLKRKLIILDNRKKLIVKNVHRKII